MEDAKVLILKLISIILIAIIGYYVQRKKLLGEHGKDGVSLLLNRVALPFMIIASYSRIQLSMDTVLNSVYVMISAVVLYLLNYVYARFSARKFNLTPKQNSVYINGAVHANSAFLAFPLLYAVYGDTGLFYATMFYIVDNVLLFTVGLKRLMHDHPAKRKLAPVTISLMIALPTMLIANYFNFDLTQTVIYSTVNDLGSLTTPLAFLFIGMIVADSNVKELILNRPAINLIIIKQVIIPILFIVFFLVFKASFESIVIVVIMVETLMPTYSSLLAMAHEYKQDVPLAASLVVLGHIFSMISIPVLFTIVTILFK